MAEATLASKNDRDDYRDILQESGTGKELVSKVSDENKKDFFR
jgi:hypothetical protein